MMSEKQKRPLDKQPPPAQQREIAQTNKTGRRGIEAEEQHRQGGNRVSDQGGKRSGK